MASMSDYLEGKLLDHVLRLGAFSMPSGLYVALFETSTADDGSGTEVSGGSYARQPVTFGPGSAPNERSNTNPVNFPNMPAVTVVSAAIYDAVILGNMLFHGPLTSPVVVDAGNTFAFAIGDIDVSMT